jgi:SAM-dependent methyltransferase
MISQPSTYVFDNAWQQEQQRLDALANTWDANTQRNFEALGPLNGLRVLEVGAGGGSVARWLCDAVGPNGHVVATDIDTRLIDAIEAPNFEARRHDIVHDALESNAFDIVHCRLVLEHLPNADLALSKMVAALKPGGALVVEEFDQVSFLPAPDSAPDAQAAWSSFLAAFDAIADQRGLDLAYGRRLRPLLEAQGLQDVRAQGTVTYERGGTADRGLLLLSIASMRDLLVSTGAMDGPAVERLIAALQDETFYWSSQVMVAARGSGRRPCMYEMLICHVYRRLTGDKKPLTRRLP